MRVEIQFFGYKPFEIDLPADPSPFENVPDTVAATEIIHRTLMGNGDEDGWVTGDAEGELFQVRKSRRTAKDDLLKACSVLFEYWDNGIAVPPGAVAVSDLRAAVSKAEAR